VTLLSVRDLRVAFPGEQGAVEAVGGVSFSLREGEVLAIVGESGSGKSATALSLTGLTREAGAALSGSVSFEGVELLGASQRRLRQIRGAGIAMIFQDPMSALNPVQRIGDQVAEQVRAHEALDRAGARQRAVAALRQAGVPEPELRSRSYPHELSGGMRQRAMIAMALSCSPRLLIADEPTTALDVTVQAQVLAELDRLRRQSGMAMLLVTHDLGVVAGLADTVLVMYAGQIVEQGSVSEVFEDPQHPYTWGLLGSIARIDRARPPRLAAIPGSPPSLRDLPAGCRFQERCPHAFQACAQPVELRPGSPHHYDRCVLTVEQKRDKRMVSGGVGL
jgi:peptide/nickel transport system ATP-binding protein/oligopeptide transport system ATP-binding protein